MKEPFVLNSSTQPKTSVEFIQCIEKQSKHLRKMILEWKAMESKKGRKIVRMQAKSVSKLIHGLCKVRNEVTAVTSSVNENTTSSKPRRR